VNCQTNDRNPRRSVKHRHCGDHVGKLMNPAVGRTLLYRQIVSPVDLQLLRANSFAS
jgi:hypothetical protein